jgi:hypothetical protein
MLGQSPLAAAEATGAACAGGVAGPENTLVKRLVQGASTGESPEPDVDEQPESTIRAASTAALPWPRGR